MKHTIFILSFVCSFFLYSSKGFSSNISFSKSLVTENNTNKQDISINIPETNENKIFVPEEFTLYTEKVMLTPAPPSYQYQYKRKEPGLAILLSILLPGGGQYYNGQYGKGALMTGIYVGSGIMIISGWTNTIVDGIGGRYNNRNTGLLAIGSILLISNYIWSIIDAPMNSIRINHKIEFGDRASLRINPDCNFINQPTITGSKITPVYGLKLNLDF